MERRHTSFLSKNGAWIIYRLDVNNKRFVKTSLRIAQEVGHVDFNKLSKINDINLSNKDVLKVSQQYLCESCPLSKFTRQTFNTKRGSLACRPLESVHMNICGPMHVPSIGLRYLYVIIDDYTRKTFAHSL